MKIKIKTKPVLLEQSWSQVLDKPREFSELGDAEGASPTPFPCKSCGKAARRVSGITPSLSSTTGSLGLIPWPVPSPCHPLPALQSQLHQQQAGLRGRGQGGQVTRMLWSTLNQQCPTPRERLEKGDATPYFWGDKQLSAGAGILHGQTFHGQPAPGSNPAAPCRVPAWHKDPACSLTGRGILVREGEGPETSRSGPQISRNGPERSLHFPPPQSPTRRSGIQLLLPAPFPIHVFICLGYLCKK